MLEHAFSAFRIAVSGTSTVKANFHSGKLSVDWNLGTDKKIFLCLVSSGLELMTLGTGHNLSRGWGDVIQNFKE
jgi:hypothetical protein